MIKTICLLLLCALFITSIAQAQECTDCHTAISKRLGGNSHHIQGVTVSGRHCYACHWEATKDGQTDLQYHSGSTDKSRGQVDLVLWDKGQRPTMYRMNETAVGFRSSDISTPREREAVANISTHCLGCHSDQNNDLRPFEGDPRTPREYAWDGQSIASRYSNMGVARWGKYSSAATNKKQRITKSFSAHGNAASNQGGWSSSSGYDEDIPLTRGGSGARNVECFDCHNSHGSMADGVTSSYRSFDGTYNGGVLKETESGQDGYKMTYRPSANGVQGMNPYNSGAGLCFDCHETAREGTMPWGYNSTFAAKQPIMGYKDTHRFGSSNKGSTSRFPNRKSRTEVASSHLMAGKPLGNSAHGQINGLCTPCHDPHGVSRTLGDNMPYALPLLKGSWLTSPYREDGPPSGTTKNARQAQQENQKIRDSGNLPLAGNAVIAGVGNGAQREPVPGLNYNIDRNTFGPNERIAEGDDRFGGLCFRCHYKEEVKGKAASLQVHRAVKGWGKNTEHAFPCSKCHQTHSSGLPRLMQTNCFVAGPSSVRDNSDLPWAPGDNAVHPAGSSSQVPGSSRKGPATGSKKAVKGEMVGCHVRQFGGGSATSKKQEVQPWKEKTAW